MSSTEPATNMPAERNIKATRLAIRHYWQISQKGWRYILPALTLTGIGTFFAFYGPPLVTAKLLARLQSNTNLPLGSLMPYVLAFGLTYFIGELLWRVAMHFLSRGESQGMERLYIQALDYLLAKDLGFFNDNFSGSLTKKTVSYATNYESVMDTLAFSVTSNLIPLLFVLPILWFFSPLLVVALVVMVSLTIAIILPLIRRRQSMVATREVAGNIVAGHVSDVISNINAVRGFGRESFEAKTHANQVHDYMRKTQISWDYQNQRINGVVSPFYVLINVVGLVIALQLGKHTSLSVAAIFVTFSYYATFTRVLWEFNTVYRVLESRITEAAQFTELLLEAPLIQDAPDPKEFVVKSGEVKLNNVSFHYSDNAGQHLFQNLNLTITSGEKVGLIGRSGGGKTTLTKLLLRFMDIDSGEILVDGQNIAHIRQVDLRSQIAYVPQEPLLFHRSLTDNIRYGRLDATDEQVVQAARQANATEFIEKLPRQFDTLVGERGVKLSGGQRQRIALARAMIKDAPILVLDEATSALDSESEKLVQNALWKLMENKTALIIAHRLSTIQRMDRILVLDDGKIVEDGSHNELLKNKGVYAKLWARQSGGFLDE